MRMVLSDLNKSKISFHRFVENLPGIVYRVFIEDNNRMVFFNDMVQTMTGYSPEELKRGKVYSIDPLILPEDRINVVNIIKDAIENNVPFEVEYRINNKSGELKWFFERGRPIKGDNGNTSYIDGVILEITKRKKVEQKLKVTNEELEKIIHERTNELKKSEEQHRILSSELETILDHYPGLAFFKDTNNNFIHINQNVVDYYNSYTTSGKANLTKKDIEGKNLSDLLPKDIAQTYWEDDLEAIKSGTPKLNIEESFKTEHGIIWLNSNMIPYFDENGEIRGIIGFSIDITESKKAEQKLIELEKKYRLLTENINDIVTIVNDKGQIEYINEEVYKKIFGYSFNDMTNKNVFPLVHQEDREKAKFELKKAFETGASSVEVRIINKKGFYKWTETNGKAFLDNDGKIKILTITRDITERRKTEEALYESEERLRNLIEQSVDGIVMVNQKGLIIEWNKGLEIISGLKREEVLEKPIWDIQFQIIPEQDKSLAQYERFKGMIRDVLKSGKAPWLGKLRDINFHHIDNEEIRTLQQLPFLITTEDKIMLGIFSRDITEQKRIQKKIQEKQATLESIFKAAPIGIGMVQNRVFTQVNDRVCKLVGYTPDELLNNNVRIVYTSDEEYEFVGKEKYAQIAKFGIGTVETKFLRKDGKIHDVLLSSVPMDLNDLSAGVTFTALDITERKKVERELKESEEKYRDLFETSPYAIVLINHDGYLIDCNDAITKFLSLHSKWDVIGKSVKEILSLNKKNKYLIALFEGHFDKIIKGENKKPFEIQLYRSISGSMWWHVQDSRVQIGNKELVQFIIQDITDRRKAEQKLKENTKFTQNVFNAIQDGLSVLDLDLNIIKVNPTMIEMYGPIDQILNRKCYDVYQKRSSPCPWCPSIKTIETGNLNTSIVPYPTSDNPTGWLELTAFPLKDKDGVVEGIIEYVKDITKRKKAEENLQLEGDNFLNILNSMEDGVYIVDQNYDLEYVNPILTKEYGHFEGIKCFKYFEDLNENCPRCKNKEVFQGKTVKGEWFSFKNQKTYDVIDTPLKKPDGSISKLGIFRDISERKKVEQELKESEKKYREAYNRAEFYKDIFAHDINNILQIILSGIQINQLIINNPEKHSNLVKISEIIKEQVIRGARLVSNVQKLSILEEVGRSLEKVEILNVLKNTVSFVNKSYKDKDLAIQIDFIGEKLFIEANNFLEDVFENLLINAIRHNKNLTIEITVRISKERIEGISYLKMEFRDNGFGVDDSMKEKIFQRGYSKQKGINGMGLGLSLVRGIIEVYNGKIWVEDRVKGDRSKGSNFVLLIPEVV